MKNKIKGGLSDNLTLKDIAKKHGVSIEKIEAQLIKGIKVEKDHTNDESKAKEIAMDHLTEYPDYYDKLETLGIDEETDASSSGAYDMPFNSQNKSNPLKIGGVKSIKNSKAIVNKDFPKWGGPNGVYVQIKEKCKKFPYCNQGDINALEILENNELINEVSNHFKINSKTLKQIILRETMKPFKNTLNYIIKDEVKKQILSEQNIGNEDVYNIECDGKLVDSFSDEKQANDELKKYKQSHPNKNFIIVKGTKKSFDELDEMCDYLNEGKNMKNEINPRYTHFAIDKDTNKIVNGWEYDHDMDKESIAEYCKMDIKDMDLNPKDIKVLTTKFLKSKGIDPFNTDNWINLTELNEQENMGNEINPYYTHFAIDKKTNKIVNGWEYDSDMDKESIAEYCKMDIKDMDLNPKDFKINTTKFLKSKGIDPFNTDNWINLTDLNSTKNDNTLEEGICEDCKKSICECDKTMYESKIVKKKKIVLKESDLIKLIETIINEDVPNIKPKNKKINKSSTDETDEKIKNYLKFDGNTNPTFPKSNTSDKIKKVNNTKEEDEIVSDNRGRGTQDLNYDNDPRKEFKERLKKSLTGDSTMGNSQDALNVVKTDTGKNMLKNSEKRQKNKKDETLYKKEKVPVKS
jgi:hypothetical protein